MTKPVSAPDLGDVISRLKTALGETGWSEDPARIAPKLVEWRDRWSGATPFLALPKTTQEVSAVVGICHAADTPITIQGGNTGLVGGQVPQGEILLSTERLRRIREIAIHDDVVIAEAGVTLAAVHEAAAGVNRRFPIGLASEGSATVGGIVSTNAGGTQVLRYGMTRSLVLGLEAVMANGEVWNGLKLLRKDNTGYDLKQLLIGGEGTLGVVTAAALKLHPIMASRAVAMLAMETPHAALELLTRAKSETGGAVEAFELMSRMAVEFAYRNVEACRDPMDGVHPWYVLTEFSSGEPGAAEAAMERFLEKAFEDRLIQDAALAQNETQAKALWRIRDDISPAQKPEGLSWKHDISVPVSRIALFVDQADAAIAQRYPGVRIAAFGHMGDGNLHYNISQPVGGDAALFNAQRDEAAKVVHDIVNALEGSISAEHGLGVMKVAEAEGYKSAVEIAAQRAIRHALDPKRILNPRVLF
jgi:FAD/FMN-containing dehydrogenase